VDRRIGFYPQDLLPPYQRKSDDKIIDYTKIMKEETWREYVGQSVRKPSNLLQQ
jgi:hypothetical protein